MHWAFLLLWWSSWQFMRTGVVHPKKTPSLLSKHSYRNKLEKYWLCKNYSLVSFHTLKNRISCPLKNRIFLTTIVFATRHGHRVFKQYPDSEKQIHGKSSELFRFVPSWKTTSNPSGRIPRKELNGYTSFLVPLPQAFIYYSSRNCA